MPGQVLLLPKVYHYILIWRLFMYLIPLVCISAIFAAIYVVLPFQVDPANNIVPAIIFILVAVFGLLFYRAIIRTRLVLASEGLYFYAPGFRIYTPWDNIIGMDSKFVGTRLLWGLKLKQPAYKMKIQDAVQQHVAGMEKDRWNFASSMLSADIFLIDEVVAGYNWQSGELGAYLQQYAPQAFKEEWRKVNYGVKEL